MSRLQENERTEVLQSLTGLTALARSRPYYNLPQKVTNRGQWLRAPPILSGSSSGGPSALFWLLWVPGCTQCTYIDT